MLSDQAAPDVGSAGLAHELGAPLRAALGERVGERVELLGGRAPRAQHLVEAEQLVVLEGDELGGAAQVLAELRDCRPARRSSACRRRVSARDGDVARAQTRRETTASSVISATALPVAECTSARVAGARADSSARPRRLQLERARRPRASRRSIATSCDDAGVIARARAARSTRAAGAARAPGPWRSARRCARARDRAPG